MIKLFEKTSLNFTTLGIGVLRDCFSCKVTEELNGEYELELEYPISGLHFNDIILDRIIVCKPDRYKNEQPFRIYSISKPLNGVINVKAAHITYDMNYYPIRSFQSTSLSDTIDKINENSILTLPFSFSGYSETDPKAFAVQKATNLRSIFYNDSNSQSNTSLVGVYEAELDIDGYFINILPKNSIGADNGVQIRYGKNLTSLTQDSNNSKNYTGVFPFYVSSQKERIEIPNSEKVYETAYIREGVEAFTQEWLSWKENGDIPLIPYTKKHPVQIKTEGQYFNHIVIWDTDSSTGDDRYFDVTDQQSQYPPTQTKIALGFDETYVTISLYEEDQGTVIDNGVVYVPGRENDAFQRIMVVDLSQSFTSDEEPTKALLRQKASEFISKNNIGEDEINVKSSFIFLSDSSEYSKIINSERIGLGDVITVIYEALGVSDKLRVKKITYDAATDTYLSVELGDRKPNIGEYVVMAKDGVSVLKNDVGFVKDSQLTSTIADGANNSYLSQNQKSELQQIYLNCPGIVEASVEALDTIVGKLLTVENAVIKKRLEAGEVVVNGTITARDGTFKGTIDVQGDKQSRINKLFVNNLSIGNVNGDLVNSNTVSPNKIHLTGFQGVLPTITLYGGREYVRDISLDDLTGTPQYYGWSCLTSIPGNPNAEKLVTQTATPFAETSTYYWNTRGFYDNTQDYDPYGYVLNSDTDILVESLSGTTTKTVTFSSSATVSRNTTDNTIDCFITVTSSDPIPENTSISVSYSVSCSDTEGGYEVISFLESTYCTISKDGATSAITLIKIPNPNNYYYPLSISIVSTSPTSKQFDVNENGTPVVSINNNFVPKESSKYSLGRGGRLWSDIYSVNSNIQSSDRRSKTYISYDLSKYDKLFDKLKPASFKLKTGESGRTHIGLIAQDVKDAMDDLDISTEDFAGYVKYLSDESVKNPSEEDYSYAIRYGEFISLAISKIQQLEKRIKILEKERGQ